MGEDAVKSAQARYRRLHTILPSERRPQPLEYINLVRENKSTVCWVENCFLCTGSTLIPPSTPPVAES